MLRGVHHHLLSMLVDALTLINTTVGVQHQFLAQFPNIRVSKVHIAPIFYMDIVRRCKQIILPLVNFTQFFAPPKSYLLLYITTMYIVYGVLVLPLYCEKHLHTKINLVICIRAFLICCVCLPDSRQLLQTNSNHKIGDTYLWSYKSE